MCRNERWDFYYITRDVNDYFTSNLSGNFIPFDVRGEFSSLFQFSDDFRDLTQAMILLDL